MDNNAQYMYQSLLAEVDEESRQDYNVDPRVHQYATRDGKNEVQTYQMPVTNQEFEEMEAGNEEDTLASPVQSAPQTIEKTSIVIIDTAQRDWVKQSNAYSFVFSFGAQLQSSERGALQIPYYYNNAMVPYSAYDMPPPNTSTNTNLTSATLLTTQQIPNNTPRIIPGSSIPVPTPIGVGATLGQTYGWRLIIDLSGNLKHIDPFTPNNILPSDRILYFPTYDPRQSRGALIGVDTVFQNVTANVGFSTQLKVSNVSSLKVARATIPIRKFDCYSSSNITTTAFNAFHSDPYLLMYVENLKGIYYGANENVQNAFTALVQQQRTPVDATTPGILRQFFDFYPWAKESFQFTPPVAQLSNAVISIADNNGNFLSHIDDLNVIMIQVSSNRSDLSSGFGTLTFYTTRDIQITNYPDPGFANYFAINELRSGDQLEFYAPTISQIVNDPNTTPALATFFNNMLDNGVFVTAVRRVDLSGSYPLLQLGYAVDAVIKTTDFANTLAIFSNLSDVVYETSSNPIPNTIVLRELADLSSLDSTIQYPRYQNVFSSFGGNYPLPILNVNMQSTYAFEVVTTQPDTTVLGKIIP